MQRKIISFFKIENFIVFKIFFVCFIFLGFIALNLGSAYASNYGIILKSPSGSKVYLNVPGGNVYFNPGKSYFMGDGATGCQDDSDCKIGLACINREGSNGGTCAKNPLLTDGQLTCMGDYDCVNGLICTNGVCNLNAIQGEGYACVVNADCSSGLVCKSGACRQNLGDGDTYCTADSDCSSGLVCNNNTCHQTLNTSNTGCVGPYDCSDPGGLNSYCDTYDNPKVCTVGFAGSGCTDGTQCACGNSSCINHQCGGLGASCSCSGESGEPDNLCLSNLVCDTTNGVDICTGTTSSGGSCADEYDYDCSTDKCVGTSRGYLCTDGNNGSPCASNSDCSSGNCDTTNGVDVCTSSTSVGYSCSINSDCSTDDCIETYNGYFCTDGNNGSPCAFNSDCSSNNCNTINNLYICTGTTTSGNPCTNNYDCSTDKCIYVYGYSNAYSPSWYFCTDGSYSSPCSSNSDCNSSNCVSGDGHQCSYYSYGSQGYGNSCYFNEDCSSDNCNSGSCAYSEYSVGETGSCTNSNECSSDNCISGNCHYSYGSVSHGNSCNYNDECDSGNCENAGSSFGDCGLSASSVGENGDCSYNNECSSDNCVDWHCHYSFMDGHTSGSSCNYNDECVDTGICNNGTCGNNHVNGSGCSNWYDCMSGYCDTGSYTCQ